MNGYHPIHVRIVLAERGSQIMEDDAALNEIVEIDSTLAEPVELAQEHMMGGIRKIVPKAFQCRLEFVAVYIA